MALRGEAWVAERGNKHKTSGQAYLLLLLLLRRGVCKDFVVLGIRTPVGHVFLHNKHVNFAEAQWMRGRHFDD